MYPALRLGRVLREARRAPPLPFDGEAEIRLRCWPWDLDMFLEMNNGRVMTLYDLGRFDLAARTGLAAAMRREGWGFAVAGGSTRYRRRVRGFEQVTMRTRALGRDARWFYLAQSMWVGAEPASAALLRTCVTERGRMLPTDRVAEAVGASDWRPPLPDWVEAWIAGDAQRPWPPEP